MACSRNKLLAMLKLFIFNISIEPMLFLFYTAKTSVSVVKENLKLERFCLVTLNHTEKECSDLINNDDIQIEVQHLDNDFLFFESVVGMVIPVIFLMFIATWSDKHGRRVPIIAPMSGFVIWSSIYLLEALFPSWPPEVLLIATFLDSCGGGFATFLMGYYSHMVDITSEETRTTRLGIVMAVKSLGIPTGQVLGPVLHHAGGYCLVFGSAAGMSIICIIYAFIMIKPKHQKKISNDSTNKTFCEKTHAFFKLLKNNLIHFIKTAYKKRPGNDRLCVIILLFAMMLANSSQPHKMFLWTGRVLKWSEDQFSMYMATTELVGQLVMLIFSLIVKFGKVHDCYIGAAVTLLLWSKLLSFGLTTRPDQWWIVYLFIISPDAFGTMTIRSLLSKICGNGEVGRVFSLLGIMEVIWGVVDNAMYAAVYDASIKHYPSAEHLFGAGITCILFSIFLWVKWAQDWDAIHLQQSTSKSRSVIEVSHKGIHIISNVHIEDRVTVADDYLHNHTIGASTSFEVMSSNALENYIISNKHIQDRVTTYDKQHHHHKIQAHTPCEVISSSTLQIHRDSISSCDSETSQSKPKDNESYHYSDVD